MIKNELKKWIPRTAIWSALLTILGYGVSWLTGYLFATDGMIEIKATCSNPAEMGLIVLFIAPVVLFPILVYATAVLAFFSVSIGELIDILKGKTVRQSFWAFGNKSK